MLKETPIKEEKGEREPKGKKTVMVDSALFAVRELMQKHPEALLYGQDVGGRLGGVFREAATLAQTFGDDRVFNTPIQKHLLLDPLLECQQLDKPIVEVQFADYIWPGLNQLFTGFQGPIIYRMENGQLVVLFECLLVLMVLAALIIPLVWSPW